MESVNDMRIKNGLMLLLTAFIWGTAFVAQSVGMDYLEPFTFNGVRSLIILIYPVGYAIEKCIQLFVSTILKNGKKLITSITTYKTE